jgi:flavodoxin I
MTWFTLRIASARETSRKGVTMRRVLVVYDSKFGNTRTIAAHIGDALGAGSDIAVDVLSTGDINDFPEDLDVLVLGAPTQRHGLEDTMRQFLESLPPGRLSGLPVAVFDTRMQWPKVLSGSAADGIAKRLSGLGAQLVVKPESFFVADKEGPLREGETERAAEWGRKLHAALSLPA